jgi:uncharacterized UPF0160 family protein
MIIATHNGSFHCDDVFSIAVLKFMYPDAQVVRTRDMDIINSADIVVDVGQVYDIPKGRFDHHQRGGAGIHEQSGIKKSSIGLVWDHYGLEMVTRICREDNGISFLEKVWERVNWNLVQIIDAGDTGTKIYESLFDGVQPYTVSQIISNFNPSWDAEKDFDNCFNNAVHYAEAFLINEINSARSVILARDKVLEFIHKAQDENSKVIVFDTHMPWMGTLIKNTYDELYVVYPSENNDWRIQCIPSNPGSFDKRKALPQSWAGQDPEELNKMIGIDDAVFCHTARFIAGAVSFKSIMKMAEKAIEE